MIIGIEIFSQGVSTISQESFFFYYFCSLTFQISLYLTETWKQGKGMREPGTPHRGVHVDSSDIEGRVLRASSPVATSLDSSVHPVHLPRGQR